MKWINISLKAAEKIVNQLINKYNYECIQVDEGTLGIGDIAMLPPDDSHYLFLIREVYLNEWSSGHQYMKCRKLPKEWKERINALDI